MMVKRSLSWANRVVHRMPGPNGGGKMRNNSGASQNGARKGGRDYELHFKIIR